MLPYRKGMLATEIRKVKGSKMTIIKVAPSILSADLLRLGEEIHSIEKAGADLVHIDVMDGHFVPNLTFGPCLVRSIRKITRLPIDVHLMISPVDPFIPEFAEAGADILTIHPEAGPHLHRSLSLIRSYGKKAGVALNPGTALEFILPILHEIDLVLVMSVNPGFGGQKFLPHSIKKINQLREIIDKENLPIQIEVDGGISTQTAQDVINAGADILVSGTAIFGEDESDYSKIIKKLRGTQ